MVLTETKPLSGREYAALQSLFAAISHFEELTPTLEARNRMVPGLSEDFAEVSGKLDTMLERILGTVPEAKLRHIKADLQNVRLYIKVEPPGLSSKSTLGFSYTPTKTLNALLGYLVEHECLLCSQSPTEARKCWIRKVIDEALPHEVEAKDGEYCKYANFALGWEE